MFCHGKARTRHIVVVIVQKDKIFYGDSAQYVTWRASLFAISCQRYLMEKQEHVTPSWEMNKRTKFSTANPRNISRDVLRCCNLQQQVRDIWWKSKNTLHRHGTKYSDLTVVQIHDCMPQLNRKININIIINSKINRIRMFWAILSTNKCFLER